MKLKLLSDDNARAVVEYHDHFMADEDLFLSYVKELEVARQAGKEVQKFNLLQYREIRVKFRKTSPCKLCILAFRLEDLGLRSR